MVLDVAGVLDLKVFGVEAAEVEVDESDAAAPLTLRLEDRGLASAAI